MTKPFFIYNAIRYLIDAPLIIISLFLTKLFVPGSVVQFTDPSAFMFILFSVIAWYTSAKISKIYADQNSKKFSEEIIYIIITQVLFVILLTSFLFLFRSRLSFTNHFLTIYFALLFLLVTLFKYALRKYVHSNLHKGKYVNQVLLIGSTLAAKDFYDTINQYYYYGYKCIGFLDNEVTHLNGCPFLGEIDNLHEILTTHDVDEVIVALPNSQYEKISRSIETCDFLAKRIRVIPDLYLYASSNIQVSSIGLLPVINLRSLPQDRWENRLLKRTFDIGFSVLFFAVLGWWLLPLIALIIRLTSPGNAFFKQERWGLNNKQINCFKFRTMVHNSMDTDDNGKYQQASRNDARITPFGKFLRKTSMDELPQFWNVLIGNMSVVGPRPHPSPLNLASVQNIDRYMLRHLVKPGITGWAQVNGSRGETQTVADMQRRVNFDLYYINRWTFGMDAQIILQTIINIFRGDQNAY